VMMAQRARLLHEINRPQQPLIFRNRACVSSTHTAWHVV
jgi:hypothetical protein